MSDKRYTMSSLNSILTIETDVSDSGRYMICVKYFKKNSIKKILQYNLRLKVNGQLYDNNFL